MQRLLLVGKNDSVTNTHLALFRRKGYETQLAISEQQLQQHLKEGDFDIAILNHTLHSSERRKYSEEIKARDKRKLVLVLHASGARDNPNADAAADSRSGPASILRCLELLHLMNVVWDHKHEELVGEYVVVVDKDRHYLFVSDAVCDLLGLRRGELIGRQIEEITHGNEGANVEKQFEEFVATGHMEGEFVLRHRSGKPVLIHYSARVQPDGCLIAKWMPCS